tara:strand:+ start:656 stop:1711 length:1056 start_codon:yes stop_codon:yes gene_type:complete
MDNALYEFQQSAGKANDEKIAQVNSAKEKLQALKESYQEKVKTPLEGIGGSLTEDGAHDFLVKASKYGLKKLGMSEENVGKIGDVLSKVKPSELLKNSKQAVTNAFKGEGKDVVKKTTQQAQDELDNFAGKTKPPVPKPDPPKPPAPGGEPPDPAADLKAQHATADSEIERNQKIVDEAGEDNPVYSESDGRIAQSQIDAQKQFKTDNPLPEEQSNIINEGTVDARLGTTAAAADDDGAALTSRATAAVSEKLGSGAAGDAADAAEQATKDAAAAALKATAKTDVKTAVEKGLTKAGEIDAEGGGPEDPISDVISLIVGGATMIGGIFSHKKKAPPITTNVPNVQLQLGVG